jgi:6-phosphogluconolactonase
MPNLIPNDPLAPIDSYPTERQPRAFGIDPSSRYLLSIGQFSNSMTSYSIDPASGKLTVLDRYLTGKNPNWVAFVVLS